MVIKRLLDSVVFGLGATAGTKLFTELEKELVGEEETDEQRAAREKKAHAERERAEKEAAKARKAEDAEARRKRAEDDRDVERELEALKKKLGR